MTIESLGYDSFFAEQYQCLEQPGLVPARISLVGRSCYRLVGCEAAQGELTGKLLYALNSDAFPVTGDWVAVEDLCPSAIIHTVFNRRTELARRAPGTESGRQIIAANVDLFFVVTSANRDFNPRRLERYITAVYDSGASPVIVLNKVDLSAESSTLVESIHAIAPGLPVVPVSARTGQGLDVLLSYLGPGKTIGLVGSSGVGKSSLANRLLGQDALATSELRNDGKGRHTTTSRELFALPGGGVLIDTPGMRELGLVDDAGGMDAGFTDIAALARDCRYADCRHQGEPGCVVAIAVAAGSLDPARLDSYHKLQREIAAAERRQDPELAGRSKKYWKSRSKVIRNYNKTGPKRNG